MNTNASVRVALSLFLSLAGAAALAVESADLAKTEKPPVFRASKILPAKLLSGPNHRVDERVVNDGYMNHYVISSNVGDLQAQSTAELTIRVREIEAIAAMQKVSTAREVQAGIEAGADSMISGVGNLLVDPVASLQGTATGVSKLFGRLGSGSDEDNDDLLGYDKAKRSIAAEFGVDAYSTNPALQAELDRLAKAKQAGGLTMKGALAPVGGAAGIALSATSATVELNAMVRDNSVAALNAINAKKLAAMGVGQDVIDLFIDSPSLSPRHQAAIVGALERMSGAEGRPLVVKQAVLTSGEDVALFRVRQLAMYIVHNDSTSKIVRFVPAGKFVIAAVDANGALLTAMPIDYMAWTANVGAIANDAGGKLAQLPGVRSRSLVLTGRASALSRQNMEALGWTVTENFSLDSL